MSVTIVIKPEVNPLEITTNTDKVGNEVFLKKLVRGFKVERVVVWLFFRLVDFVFIPLFIIRCFKKKKTVPPIENNILLYKASELSELIRTQQLTSTLVVNTYINRIKCVNKLLNAVIDERFDLAIEEAKAADNLIQSAKFTTEELKNKYPLLGVPLTVKGSIDIANLRNTSGLITRKDVPPAEKDADTVALAREAGAIPLVTTNIPELCLNWESINNLKGITNNPYDVRKTAGGSSGGECSLIGAGASLIGIGSDIAGSLRLPAHFCGTWGHKPTPGTVSFRGHYPSCEDEASWTEVFTLGPIARYATDLRMLLDIIAKPSAKKILELNKPVDISNIRIFYFEEINSPIVDKTNKNVKAAINKVISHFDSICKVKCTKINIDMLNYGGELSYLKLSNINDIDNLFKGRGEGSVKELFRFITFRSKFQLTSICYGLLRKFINVSKHKQNIDMYVEDLKEEIMDIIKHDGVLICPTFPHEAHFHRDIYRKLFNPVYCSLFNALGMPVTNCPILMTDNGMPVGLQVATSPNSDRLSLAIAEEIEKSFGGWQPPL